MPRFVAAVALVAVLVSLSSAQPLIGPFRQKTTNDLTANMYYCSTCYSVIIRQAYCHRLALGKYFSRVCKLNNDAPCVASSQLTISQAFTQLTSATPTSVTTTITVPRGIESSRQVTSSFPGLDTLSLQCDAFAGSFINTGDGGLDSDKEDAEVASDGLKDDLVEDLEADLTTDDIQIERDLTEVDTIFDKFRPSGTMQDTQPAPLDTNDTVRFMFTNFNTGASGVVNDSWSSSSIERPASGNDAGVTNEEMMVAPRVPGVAPRTVLSGGDDTSLGMEFAQVGMSARLDLPFLVRQRSNPLPYSTKVKVFFSRPVYSGRVRQVFRILLERRKVLRTYRKGFRVVQLNKNRKVYAFYAYFSEPYRTVYRKIRSRF